MRIQLTRASSPYSFPRSAVIAGAVLASLGVLAAALQEHYTGPVTCPFRLVTGYPCAACGMVRTVGHLLRGEFLAAFRLNPLDAVTMLVGVPAAVCLWVANRSGRWTVRVDLNGRERLWVWLGAVAAIAANWLYVLRSSV